MKNDISNRIKLLIDYLKLNKSSFSKAIGLSNNVTIGRIINENRKPSYDVIEKILLTFGNVNANWLLTGKGEMIIGGGGTGSYQLTEAIGMVNEIKSGYSQSELLNQKEKEIERLMGIIEMIIKEGKAGQMEPGERKTG